MATQINQAITNYIKNSSSIVSSETQTKLWRQGCTWYDSGKRNECELFQRAYVEDITGQVCNKSDYRLNILSNAMVEKKYPMKSIDGFEWTEDFDGFIPYKNNSFYFNFKMICDAGGVQTRSLREVYHFVSIQLNYLNNHLRDEPNKNMPYFVNILDGDTSFKHMNKFQYLLNKEQYANIRKNVFIGDMAQFQQDFWEPLANKEPTI